MILLFCTTVTKGQDIHFSQFYASSVYLNPAFAGAGVCSRLSATYRNQWPGETDGYTSSLVSFDHYIRRHSIGFGLLMARDVAGSGDLSRTLINPILSYEARISRKLGLRFGVQPGFGKSSVDFSRLTFGDQIARGGNVATVEQLPNSAYYLDIGAGVLAYANRYWLGTSFYHINAPDESLISNNESKVPLRISVHGGYKFLLSQEGRSISTAFNYRSQQDFKQLDLGAYYTVNMFNVGLWYRGIPVLKTFNNTYRNNDAFSVIVGLKTDLMNIGYSYDFTISRLNNSTSNGAHEISIAYQFCSLSKQKKRRIFVECPSF